MRIFHAAATELVEEPGRLVVLDESPLWSQTEKVKVILQGLSETFRASLRNRA